MTNLFIFIGLAFLFLNLITYFTLVDVLQYTKQVKSNQHDILDLLEDLTYDNTIGKNK